MARPGSWLQFKNLTVFKGLNLAVVKLTTVNVTKWWLATISTVNTESGSWLGLIIPAFSKFWLQKLSSGRNKTELSWPSIRHAWFMLFPDQQSPCSIMLAYGGIKPVCQRNRNHILYSGYMRTYTSNTSTMWCTVPPQWSLGLSFFLCSQDWWITKSHVSRPSASFSLEFLMNTMLVTVLVLYTAEPKYFSSFANRWEVLKILFKTTVFSQKEKFT
jgi:hypothetical protein